MNQYEMKQKAYQSTLKSRALQVLVYLIDRSNKEGTCYPAISTMSRELHISVSTVKRALKELTDSGFVKKESRFREKNNGQTSNLYILYFLEKAEVPVEAKTEEKGNDDSKELIPQEQVVILEKKQSVKDKKTEGDYILSCRMWAKYIYIKIVNISAEFCYNSHWTGEAVNLIPP